MAKKEIPLKNISEKAITIVTVLLDHETRMRVLEKKFGIMLDPLSERKLPRRKVIRRKR